MFSALMKAISGGKMPDPHSYPSSAPCIPQALDTHLECQAGDLSVAWQTSRGALHYSVVAKGSAGDVLICDTANATCNFTGLPCSQDYNVTVTASDDTCNSSGSLAGVASTGNSKTTVLNYSFQIIASVLFLLHKHSIAC